MCRNLQVHDINIDKDILDYLWFMVGTYDRADFEKMTVTFGCVT
jgi:hypothetical protein